MTHPTAHSRDCTCGHPGILHREYGRGACIEHGCDCAGVVQGYYEPESDAQAAAYQEWLDRGGAQQIGRPADRPRSERIVVVRQHDREGRVVRSYTRRVSR